MPVDARTAPYGVALLRIALGVMFIAHSVYLKFFVFTLAGTAGFFESLGLPAFTAYLVFGGEAVAGVALVLGIQARWAALATVPILIGVIWVHSGNGWLFSAEGGGWEYPVFLTVLAVAQAMLGDGAWALWRSIPLPGFGAAARA